MRLIATIAVLGLGCGGSRQPPPAPTPTPLQPVSTEAEATPDLDAEQYSCKALRSDRVSINIRAGYTASDVATWLLAWSCRTVVVPSHVRDRHSQTDYTKLVAARELPKVLDELLAQLDLVAVTQGRVTVFVGADKRLTDGKPGLVWQPTEPEPKVKLPAEIEEGIVKLDDTHYKIRRSVVDGFVNNPSRAGKGARIVPSIKNGKPNGFKLYAIRPSSLWAKIGLMNGDTIRVINGHALTTPDVLLEVYTKVRDASVLTVELTRRGRPVEMSYTIE